MVGVNNNNNNVPEHMEENDLQQLHQQDGAFASVTEDEENQVHEPYIPSDPLMIAPVQPGAPMETIMAALVNAIN
ncbi:hypothetical protein A2U01_0074828, partial [Trifolium medium]|nr:hypothetical protein [Trifolium medium]